MAYRIFSYSTKSKSANLLKDALDATFIDSGSYPKDVVINWGCGYKTPPSNALNKRLMVGIDKREFFTSMEKAGVAQYLPKFWLSNAGILASDFPVVCRTVLDGKDGDGIVIAEKSPSLVSAKLYTKFIKAVKEYRVHVGKNLDGTYTVLLVQWKGKKNGSTKPDTNIKTTSNDYVLVHGDPAPESVIQAAVNVFEATGMDFGALDVVYDGQKGYVLEVNSAPELGKIAVDAYKTFFEGHAVGSENTNGKAKSNEGADVSGGHGLLGTGAKSPIGVGEEAGSGLGQQNVDVHADVLKYEPHVADIHTTKGIGAVAVVSGGDTSGLMKQLQDAIQMKIDAAKAKAYEEGIKEGFAKAPKGFTKADLDAAEAKGAASVKSALKSLLAA